MEKLKMHSPNLTQDNIARIRDLFPGCVTEAKGEDGTVKLAVDFDQLRQELAESIVEGPQERYHLNWPGKREALLAANAPIAKTLRPCYEESVDFDSTKNLFIEGDNLDALKLLQDTYLGKVKMIYIDPPYNTGNDFVYEDDFAQNTEDYLQRSNQKDAAGNRLHANTEANGRFHSDWLSMMYPRLKLARNLLRDDGVVFISIDDNEQANLKRLCDEVFGEDNFVAVIPWKGKGGGADNKYLMLSHEYVLLYAKSKSSFTVGEEVKENEVFPKFDSIKNRKYKTQLVRKWGANSKRSDRPNLFYSVKSPNGDDVFPILPDGSDGCWRWSKSKMQEEIQANNVEFISNENGWVAYEKIYEPLKGEFNTKKFSTWFDDFGTTANGTKEIKELFDKIGYFDFPKPTSLLSVLVRIANTGNNDIILDFFSGSATTAHAVMQLNAEDGGKRQFIMVQLPEACDPKSEAFKAGYKTIADIGKERIRRAGQKIKADNTDKEHIKQLDIGFRTLKIDTSNMADVFYTPDALNKESLDMFVNNIKPDRAPEDLLFQVMLDWGVDLALPITKQSIQGKDVFFVDGNALAACFDASGSIDEAFVKELAKHQPLRVVFRDAGYKNSAVKINVEQIFKLLSPATEVKCI